MRILGMISGTSHDGVDAAVVDLEPAGDGLDATVVHQDSTPYPPELRRRLVAALPPHPVTADELCRLDTLVGRHFADVAAQAVAAAGPVDAVCSHGQTVYHWVDEGTCRGTLQIGQPAWIAERLGVPVVADVRARDVAAGGHGAPLVPLLDTLLLSGLGDRGPAVALNLGGIANMTVVGAGEVTAYDIGPANALVDAVVQDRELDPAGYDTDGRLAARGSVHPRLLEQLLADPYYAAPPPKSTGKETFHGGYVDDQLSRLGEPVADADLVATLTRLTAEVVARDVRRVGADVVVGAGGGVENPVLMAALADLLPGVRLVTTAAYGLAPEIKEAVAFALIGWCTLHSLPANVPSATGAGGPRVLGAIIPGSGPWRLPEPRPMPRALRIRSGP